MNERVKAWLADLERINSELQSIKLKPGHKPPATPRGKS